MENNYLDQVIKDKLQQLEVAYQEETWELLEQKLGMAEDATPLEDTAFDTLIINALKDYQAPDEPDWAKMSHHLDNHLIDTTVLGALENIEIPFEENHWAAMSQRLDNELIDSTVAGALTGIEIPYQESNWEMISQRLDDQMLDEKVYETLHNFGVPYSENHWTAMSQRLDVIFARPLHIIRYKLVELAFLFFLFFGIGQFIPAKLPTTSLPVVERSLEKVNEITDEIATENTFNEKQTKQNVLELPKLIEQSSIKTKAQQSKQSTSIENGLQEKQTKKTGVFSEFNSKAPTLVTTLPVRNDKYLVIEQEDKTKQTVLSNLSAMTDPHEGGNVDENSSTIEPSKEAVTVVTTTLEEENKEPLESLSLLVSDISLVEEQRDKDLSSVSLLNIQTKKKAKIRVGMFGSANTDFIFTPYDPVLGLTAYRRYSPGYGGGISLGWKYDRWELETAITYMAKRYRNRPYIHIYDGSVQEGFQANFLTGIELNMVNIPLHVNYHVINSGKWHFYGLTGGTMQVVLQANYDANRAELGGGQGASFSGGVKVSEDNTKSVFSRKDFNDGFLTDKNFKKNSYYSIDVGMGLERYITPYWNVFLQPTYQYNLPEIINTDGLGPNNDRINTFKLLIGVKSNLN